MGKSKRSRAKASSYKPYSKASPIDIKSQPPLRKPTNGAKPPPPHVPFSATDRVLLVGEGDFSFSNSLLSAHGCIKLIATSYDEVSVLRSKYPQAASNIAALETEENCMVRFGVDATKLGKPGTAVGGGGGKEVKKGGFDKVVFNFPHVGGLTKDRNRQVRHNQGCLLYRHGIVNWADRLAKGSSSGFSRRRFHYWLLQDRSSSQSSTASPTICGTSEISHGMWV